MPSFQPTAIYLTSIQQLLDWKPGAQPYDAFNIALVPKIKRPSPTGAQLLDCNDFMGGYSQDLYPQGGSNTDIYSFSFWQYVDYFCYFTHQRVGIPTTWWINRAHQCGVPVLANLIFEGNGGVSDFKLLLDNSAKAVTQMAAMAAHYGFDGWFLNMESNLPSGHSINDVVLLLKNLKAAGQIVVWYDALATSGQVSYQNCLDEEDLPFFLASDGIFTNYWWDSLTQTPVESAAVATENSRSPFGVQSGIDVYGRVDPSLYTPGLGCLPAVTSAVQGGTSVGLFAPGWTFENAGGSGETQYQSYLALDRQFWLTAPNAVATSIPPRAVPGGLPFASNFSSGRGNGFAVRGQATASQGWGNLNLQAILPTYQWKMNGTGANAFTLALTDATPWDGGSSLSITSNGATASSADSYRLYDMNAAIGAAGLTASLIFQPMQTGGWPQVNLQLSLSDGSTLTTTALPVQTGGWYKITQTFAEAGGKSVTGVSLAVGPCVGTMPSGSYGVTVGAVSLTNAGQAAPGPVTGLSGWPLATAAAPNSGEVYLTWTAPSGTQVRFYDIYQQTGGGWTWLMRVTANAAWVPGITAATTFAVQPVDFGLTAQPIASAATVTVAPAAASSFDDTGTALLNGQPVTLINLVSGDVVNAVQTTNGGPASSPAAWTWQMPRHGGTIGTAGSFKVPAGDVITQISGYTGDWYGRTCVLQVTFKTRNGTTSPAFGTMANATTKSPFTLTAPSGQQIIALKGTFTTVPLAGGQQTQVLTSLNASFAPAP